MGLRSRRDLRLRTFIGRREVYLPTHEDPKPTSLIDQPCHFFRFYGELQLVHKRSQYSDMEVALSKTDGVAILSIFVDIDPEEPNESAGFLVRAGAKVLYVSKKTVSLQ